MRRYIGCGGRYIRSRGDGALGLVFGFGEGGARRRRLHKTITESREKARDILGDAE